MKKELVNEFVTKLSNNMEAIEQIIKSNLGVDCKFEVKICGMYEDEIYLQEVGNGSTEILTSHPLLSQMFKKSEISIHCWYFEDKNEAQLSVNINYDHNYRSGSNGHSLMDVWVNLENGEIIGKEM